MEWAKLTFMDYMGKMVVVPKQPDFLPPQTLE